MNSSPKCNTDCIFISTPLSAPSVHTCYLTYICPDDRERELAEIERQNEAEMERYYRDEERKERIRNEMKEDFWI